MTENYDKLRADRDALAAALRPYVTGCSCGGTGIVSAVYVDADPAKQIQRLERCDVCEAAREALGMRVTDEELAKSFGLAESTNILYVEDQIKRKLADRDALALRCATYGKSIGNVLDHWEQLPNDLRSDPGFESLDKALTKLYQFQRESGDAR